MKRLSVVALVTVALVVFFAGMFGLYLVLVPPVSTNWAGYETTMPRPTMISADWIVPTIASSRRPAAVATWIGLGGTTRAPFLQVGICETTRTGSVGHDAWLELWPAPARPLTRVGAPSDTITPGDHVSASITSVRHTQWAVRFADLTAGWSYVTTVRFSPKQAHTAEWITERPPSVGRLPRFTPARFTHLMVAESGSRPAVPHRLSPIRMLPVHGSTVAVGPVHRDAFTDSYMRSS